MCMPSQEEITDQLAICDGVKEFSYPKYRLILTVFVHAELKIHA